MKFLFAILIAQLILFPVPGALHAEDSHAQHTEPYYQCSMHPKIISDKPGNCPICGMKLTLVQPSSAKGEIKNGRAAVEISPERQQMIGLTKEKAVIRPLIYSVHSVGNVAYNPDIAMSLAEYREAYAAYRKTRANPSESVKERGMKVLELAELKLRLSGMSGQQAQQVKNASFDTRVINNFYSPEGLDLPEGRVWVDTDLYESDSEVVQPGQKVDMTSPTLPGKKFRGTVRTTDSVLNEFPRKVRVRIETEDDMILKPGMAMDVRIMVELGDKLAVPESALIDSGHEQIVFVDQGNGHIEPREVQAGQNAGGYYEIVAGLHEGETVVTSAAFLVDSETRLRAAAQSFSQRKAGEAAPGEGHRH